MLPLFVNDEVFFLAEKCGEWLGDFFKVLSESRLEANVLEKAPLILYSSHEREVMDDL